MFKSLLEEAKKRFLSLETLEGSAYLTIGGILMFAYITGLIAVIVKLTPIAGIVFIAAGTYKTFIKRD